MSTVAILHFTAPPVVGGVESVIDHHARMLVAAGHSVRVIAGRGQATDRRITFQHIPLLDSLHSRVLTAKQVLDAGQVPAQWQNLVTDIRTRLQDALVDVDVVFAHNVASLHKNLAFTTALFELSQQPDAPRVVLWHHDIAWDSQRYGHELHAGMPWDLLRMAWPNTTQVTISSARQKELAQLLTLPVEDIIVIPNGVSPRLFLKLGHMSIALVNSLNLMEASPLLLMPVRLTGRKNIELALHSLAELLTHMPEARLLITGPLGPHNPANENYFASLKALRSELKLETHAHFLAEQVSGFIPDEVISDFYHLADALLLPSKDEGFGIPVLEAGLAGIPVFCSNIPALQELGGEEANYFSPEADPKGVAALIHITLISSQVWRLRNRVRQQYSWQQIYNQHLAPLVAE